MQVNETQPRGELAAAQDSDDSRNSGSNWSTIGMVACLVAAALRAGLVVGFWVASGDDAADASQPSSNGLAATPSESTTDAATAASGPVEPEEPTAEPAITDGLGSADGLEIADQPAIAD